MYVFFEIFVEVNVGDVSTSKYVVVNFIYLFS